MIGRRGFLRVMGMAALVAPWLSKLSPMPTPLPVTTGGTGVVSIPTTFKAGRVLTAADLSISPLLLGRAPEGIVSASSAYWLSDRGVHGVRGEAPPSA